MKKLIILSIAFLSILSAYGQKKVKGNGNMTTITRNTGDYNSISCAGSFDYILVSGTEGRLTIEGEENLMDYIITEVKGDKLVVKVKDFVSLRPSLKKGIKITIPFQDIASVALAGSGDLWTEDTISSDAFETSLAGSGDIVLEVNAKHIKSNLSGSGDITLKGSTDSLETRVSGSGDFHGFDLQSNNTEAYISGSGDIDVVSNSQIKARVSGSGSVEYRGNPELKDTKVAGSGRISG